MSYQLTKIWNTDTKSIYNINKNIGIGTNIPQYKLDVKGIIYGEQIIEQNKLLKDKYVQIIGKEKFTDILVSKIPKEYILNSDITDYDTIDSNLLLRFRMDKGESILKNTSIRNEIIGNDNIYNYYSHITLKIFPENIDIDKLIGANFIIGNACVYLNTNNYLYLYSDFQIKNEIINGSVIQYNDHINMRYEDFDNLSFTFWIRLEYDEIIIDKYYTILNFISKSSNGYDRNIKLYVQNNTLFLFIKNTQDKEYTFIPLSGFGIININEWYHIDIIFKKNNLLFIDIYINGILQHYTFQSIEPINVDEDYWISYIGKGNTQDENFQGYIDDFRMYNTSITVEQIKQYLTGEVLKITTKGVSTFGNTGIHLEPYQEKIGLGTLEPLHNIHIKGETFIEGQLITPIIHNDSLYSSNININNATIQQSYINSNIILDELKILDNSSINLNDNFYITSNEIKTFDTHKGFDIDTGTGSIKANNIITDTLTIQNYNPETIQLNNLICQDKIQNNGITEFYNTVTFKNDTQLIMENGDSILKNVTVNGNMNINTFTSSGIITLNNTLDIFNKFKFNYDSKNFTINDNDNTLLTMYGENGNIQTTGNINTNSLNVSTTLQTETLDVNGIVLFKDILNINKDDFTFSVNTNEKNITVLNNNDTVFKLTNTGDITANQLNISGTINFTNTFLIKNNTFQYAFNPSDKFFTITDNSVSKFHIDGNTGNLNTFSGTITSHTLNVTNNATFSNLNSTGTFIIQNNTNNNPFKFITNTATKTMSIYNNNDQVFSVDENGQLKISYFTTSVEMFKFYINPVDKSLALKKRETTAQTELTTIFDIDQNGNTSCSGNSTIHGNATINGNLTVTGDITGTFDYEVPSILSLDSISKKSDTFNYISINDNIKFPIGSKIIFNDGDDTDNNEKLYRLDTNHSLLKNVNDDLPTAITLPNFLINNDDNSAHIVIGSKRNGGTSYDDSQSVISQISSFSTLRQDGDNTKLNGLNSHQIIFKKENNFISDITNSHGAIELTGGIGDKKYRFLLTNFNDTNELIYMQNNDTVFKIKDNKEVKIYYTLDVTQQINTKDVICSNIDVDNITFNSELIFMQNDDIVFKIQDDKEVKIPYTLDVTQQIKTEKVRTTDVICSNLVCSNITVVDNITFNEIIPTLNVSNINVSGNFNANNFYLSNINTEDIELSINNERKSVATLLQNYDYPVDVNLDFNVLYITFDIRDNNGPFINEGYSEGFNFTYRYLDNNDVNDTILGNDTFNDVLKYYYVYYSPYNLYGNCLKLDEGLIILNQKIQNPIYSDFTFMYNNKTDNTKHNESIVNLYIYDASSNIILSYTHLYNSNLINDEQILTFYDSNILFQSSSNIIFNQWKNNILTFEYLNDFEKINEFNVKFYQDFQLLYESNIDINQQISIDHFTINLGTQNDINISELSPSDLFYTGYFSDIRFYNKKLVHSEIIVFSKKYAFTQTNTTTQRINNSLIIDGDIIITGKIQEYDTVFETVIIPWETTEETVFTQKQVGIGTINPTVSLDVKGIIRTDDRISIFNEGEARYHCYNYGMNTEWLWGQKNNSSHDWTLSSMVKNIQGIESEHDRLIVSKDGNVGIGTNAPITRLHITSPSSGDLIVLDHENEYGYSGILFRSRIDRGSDHAYIRFYDNTGSGQNSKLIIGTEDDNNDDIVLQSKGIIQINTSGGIFTNNNLYIKHSFPTIYLIDTEIATPTTSKLNAILHVNDGKFYMLRGTNEDGTWEVSKDTNTSDRWPLVINLNTSEADFGGKIKEQGTLLSSRYALIDGSTTQDFSAKSLTFEEDWKFEVNDIHILGITLTNSLTVKYNENIMGYFVQDNVIGIIDFTGQHGVHTLQKDIKYKKGYIVCVSDEGYWKKDQLYSYKYKKKYIDIIECLPMIRLSTQQKDKSVLGVISDKRQDFNMSPVKFYNIPEEKATVVNSLGEGAIWISNFNGNIENGDYITTSDIPGVGMRQDDDILHNYTVAKITMSCDFEPNFIPIMKASTYNSNVLSSDGSHVEKEFFYYDSNNDYIYEQEYDSNNNPVYDWEYEMKYIRLDGTIIDKNTYDIEFSSNLPVYKMAFVGCTYHCG